MWGVTTHIYDPKSSTAFTTALKNFRTYLHSPPPSRGSGTYVTTSSLTSSGCPPSLVSCCPCLWGCGQVIWRPPRWWAGNRTPWTPSSCPSVTLPSTDCITSSPIPCQTESCWYGGYLGPSSSSACHSRGITGTGRLSSFVMITVSHLCR